MHGLATTPEQRRVAIRAPRLFGRRLSYCDQTCGGNVSPETGSSKYYVARGRAALSFCTRRCLYHYIIIGKGQVDRIRWCTPYWMFAHRGAEIPPLFLAKSACRRESELTSRVGVQSQVELSENIKSKAYRLE
jgi:ribosomal protein L24E